MGLVLSQYFLMRRPSGSPHIINSSTGKNVIKDSKKKDSIVIFIVIFWILSKETEKQLAIKKCMHPSVSVFVF